MPSLIIDPFHRSDEQHPFRELSRDPERLKRTMARFQRILESSFDFDAMRDGEAFARRIATQNEVRRRTQILAQWFRTLRGMGHSVERAMDDLSRALRCTLDGQEYRPPPLNRVWLPGGQE